MSKLLLLASLLVSSSAIAALSGQLFTPAEALSSGYGYGSNTAGGSDSHANYAPTGIHFPPQFYVTTGTTIPFVGADPVAQSGAIYYDELNQRVRVDNFWLGNQRSFIVDLVSQRGYLVANDQCTVLKLTGGLKRYGVPDGAVRSLDPVAVRGVPVLHYSAVEKEETVQLVDFFVRPMNLSSVFYAGDDDEAADSYENSRSLGEYKNKQSRTAEDDAESALSNEEKVRLAADAKERENKMKEDVGGFFVPWQIRTKRLRQRTIAPSAATDLPNWRFFGEPMDEVITAEDAAEEFGGNIRGPDGKPLPHSRGAVEKLVEDVTVTVDFFNFVPSPPAASIFDAPLICRDQEPKHEFDYNVNVHQAQRLLVDMAFNSKHGRKLMDHLWKAEFVRRVAAGEAERIKQDAAKGAAAAGVPKLPSATPPNGVKQPSESPNADL